FDFDGLGDGVSLGNPVSLQLQTLTIAAWLRRSSASVASLEEQNAPGGEILLYGDSGYAFGIFDDGTVFLSKAQVSAVNAGSLKITDTDWHHVAVTKAADSVVFYVDGIETAPVSYD